MPHRFTSKASRALIGMERELKQGTMIISDMLLLMLSVWGAYSLRLGIWFLPNKEQLLLMVAAPLLSIPVFVRFGLYRSVVRYMGEHALWAVLNAVGLSALLWATLAFMTSMTGVEGVPRTVPVLYGLLATMLVAGSRFLARWVLWLPMKRRYSGGQVLIYGAGAAGRQLAMALRNCQQLFPAGFVDEDPDMIGKDLDGLRVYAPHSLRDIIEKFGIQDIIVTMPSASNSKRREIVEFLERYPVKVRILPAVTDIANGKHLVNMVREVDIGDLLGRDPVAADPELLGRCITGKVVLVTGAGGSIGSELCRQVAGLHPERMVLLDVSEYALYKVDRLVHGIVECEVVSCLGSVGDTALVEQLMREQGVQTVYHAAAYKHVPLVECNIAQGIRNNVLGTQTIAGVAYKAGVETFVLISTDKAVRPTNVMGATKRWAEMVVQDYARKAQSEGSGQIFCAVRFGNVLGSSGSVIPLFREQITNGGPVTVTHNEVTRYFMSIHEAVELVIQAGSLAEGGEVFLLDMGEPVKIIDLARNMIRLAGHEVRDEDHPAGDIDIDITGLRPGEKLYEELLIANDNAVQTRHVKIMKALEPCPTPGELADLLLDMRLAIKSGNETEMKQMLMMHAGCVEAASPS